MAENPKITIQADSETSGMRRGTADVNELTQALSRVTDAARKAFDELRKLTTPALAIPPPTRTTPPYPMPPGGGLGRGEFPSAPLDPRRAFRMPPGGGLGYGEYPSVPPPPNPAAQWGGVVGAQAANARATVPAAWGSAQGAMLANTQAAQGPLAPNQAAWSVAQGIMLANSRATVPAAWGGTQGAMLANIARPQGPLAPNPAAWAAPQGAMLANIQAGRPAAWGGIQGAMLANIAARQAPLAPNPAAWGGIQGAMLANINVGRPAAWGGVQGAMLANINAAQPPLPPPPAPPGQTPPSGPFSPWPAGPLHRASAAAINMAPALAGAARMVGGTALGLAGYTSYQVVAQTLQNFEQRSRGVLAVGSLLDEQYGEVDTTLRQLRNTYHVLGQEGTAAMLAVGRATGTLNVDMLSSNIRAGRAYGMAPEQVGILQGSLARLGGSDAPDLSILSAIRNQMAARGVPVLPTAGFMEQATEVAGVGGLGGVPMGNALLGNTMGLMGDLYGRRGAFNPADAFARYAGGIGRQGSDMVEALRHRAVARLAQRMPTVVLGKDTPEEMTLNIAGNWQHRRILMEKGGFSPEYQGALAEEAQGLSRGNEALHSFWTGALFGEESPYLAERISRNMPAGRTLEQRLLTAPDMYGEMGRQAQRVTGQRTDPAAAEGFKLRERDATRQILAETEAAKAFSNALTSVTNGVGEFTKAMQQGEGIIKGFVKGVAELDPIMVKLVTLGALGVAAFTPAGPLVTGGGAVVGGTGALLTIYQDLQKLLAGHTTTQPTKLGP